MKIEKVHRKITTFSNVDEHSYFEQLQHPEEKLRAELDQLLNSKPSLNNSHRINVIVDELLNCFDESISDDSLLSINSIKSIKFNWNKFVQWCLAKSVRYLPASITTFELFIKEQSQFCKSSTLQVFVWAVNTIHDAAGLPSPTKNSSIKNLLKGVKKRKARNGEVISQVSPFKEVHLDTLITLWGDSNLLIETRNLTLLCFAYETLLRESELARIQFKDITFRADGRAVLTIPYTKTNHSGLADKVMLSKQSVNLLKKYIEQLSMPMEGLVFRPILKSNKVRWHNNAIEYNRQKPLTGFTVDKIFQLGLITIKQNEPFTVHNIEKWSGHSARVGACQDLLAKGHSHIAAQQSGRWSSIEMVYRYGRDILAEDGAMIKSRWDK